jgi:hypothetical protein
MYFLFLFGSQSGSNVFLVYSQHCEFGVNIAYGSFFSISFSSVCVCTERKHDLDSRQNEFMIVFADMCDV